MRPFRDFSLVGRDLDVARFTALQSVSEVLKGLSGVSGGISTPPDMMPMSKTVQHAGMANNALLCNRCGARQELTLPQPVDSVVALMKAWGKAHAKCKGDRIAFRQAQSLHAWPDSDDTGMSSKAIYRHMRGLPGDFPYPHDPSDFGRCYRLLLLAPEWRSRITEMSQYGKEWAALSSAWEELTTLYEEEAPRGAAPKLYARMKLLQDGVA